MILRFSVNAAPTNAFGCVTMGLAGTDSAQADCPIQPEGVALEGTFEACMEGVRRESARVVPTAAIVLLGDFRPPERFISDLSFELRCPILGGRTAAPDTGEPEAKVFLVTDPRYRVEASTKNIFSKKLDVVALTLENDRCAKTIEGEDALVWYNKKRRELGIPEDDFEHLTLATHDGVNAHLSVAEGKLCSGRDLHRLMRLRYAPHEEAVEEIKAFYNDENAIVFGCAGLKKLYPQTPDTKAVGLYLFGEVVGVGERARFGNLMLSKLKFIPVG